MMAYIVVKLRLKKKIEVLKQMCCRKTIAIKVISISINYSALKTNLGNERIWNSFIAL